MMRSPTTGEVGRIAAIWRYPVKSMGGEQVEAASVEARGLAGDRGRAVVDAESGFVGSAKHPRKWSRLLLCRAAYITEPKPKSEPGRPLPAVRIALPDGGVLHSDAVDAEEQLSQLVGRPVRLQTGARSQPTIEKLWPADGGIAPRGEPSPDAGGEPVTTVEISRGVPGGLFDFAALQLLSTATLAHLQQHHAAGRFDARRFRPNLVIETDADTEPFPESGWVGRTLAIDELRLRVLMPVPRCVVTTLPQGDLPADPEILRTVARHNRVPAGTAGELSCVGVYLEVLQGGTVRRGARLRLV